MFTVTQQTESGFSKIILQDEVSGTSAGIIPACGAILDSFIVQSLGQSLNVIDHYNDLEDFEKNVTGGGFKSCKLSPFACRINKARYRFSGREYTIKKFLLNGSALHGLLYDATFHIVEMFSDEKKAELTLLYAYRGTDPGYPFHFDCSISYRLTANNSLTISTTISNKDEAAIPVQDGWHPYFSLGVNIDQLELEFQSGEKLEFNAELIPTGKLIPYQEYRSAKKIADAVFDNCFTVDLTAPGPKCILRDAVKNIQVEIAPDKHYPYLQIYTPPHRKSIAIENLSAAPDAFNNGMGLMILQPGDNREFTTRYTISMPVH